MATPKKNKYIEQDLEWLEGKTEELKKYIDSRPFNKLKDRKGYRPTAKGGQIEYVIASIEQQRQDLTKALNEYAQLLEAISRLKTEEEKKIRIRGEEELTPMESGEAEQYQLHEGD